MVEPNAWATNEELIRRVEAAYARRETDLVPIVEWFFAHRHGLMRYAGSLGIRSVEDQEDFFQSFIVERLLYIWTMFCKRDRTPDGFKPYVFRIFRHDVWNHLKATRPIASATVPLDEAREETKAIVRGASVDEAEWQWQADLLEASIDQLPPGEREVIHLWFRQQMTLPEIEDYLGINSNAVRTRKSRGLQKVQLTFYRGIYHVAADEVFDWFALSAFIRESTGPLERVRNIFSPEELLTLVAVGDGDTSSASRSRVIHALNTRVIDVKDFYGATDLIAAVGTAGAAVLAPPPNYIHLHVNRVVLQKQLSVAIAPAPKVLL